MQLIKPKVDSRKLKYNVLEPPSSITIRRKVTRYWILNIGNHTARGVLSNHDRICYESRMNNKVRGK